MEEVPRRTSLVPLAFPCFVLRLIGLETKNVLDYQGRAGDHFHCTVERSSGHIRCRNIQGPIKQNASPGDDSEAPKRRWKPRKEQHPGPGNQDSQHMLNQPRGSFPDLQRKKANSLVPAVSFAHCMAFLEKGGGLGLVYVFGGGLVFCLRFWLFAKQKQHILAILRQKWEKGRNKKEDQTWSCFFWSKSALFPQF